MNIKDIGKEHIGKDLTLHAKVSRITQTSGPTLFELKDATGTMTATAFSEAGKRTYPDLHEGDAIVAKVGVKEHNNQVELALKEYTIKEDESQLISREREFLIASEGLEKLRPQFIEAAQVIHQAIEQGRPIVIRHHDDTDGYSAGLALEMVIRPLQHKSRHYLNRISTRTPYYDYIDALRDLSSYLVGKNRFEDKAPLVILTDLGSNEQSIKAIRRLKSYGMDFVIVDHHRYDEANKEASRVFLNPHLYGLGSDLNAGALATELAFFLNAEMQIKHLPALSGVADKSSGADFEKYVQISGYSLEELQKWALVVDHETYYLRFSESSEFLQDMLLSDHVVKTMFEGIECDFTKVIISAKKYVERKAYDSFTLQRIHRHMVGRSGDYASSKLTRITHDLLDKPRITLSLSPDGISFREDGVPAFSVLSVLKRIQDNLPHAMAEGGGHDSAGSIRFNAASYDEVMAVLETYLREIDSNK